MSAFDTVTLKAEINTILKKSGELMETFNRNPVQTKTNKNSLKTSECSFLDIEDRTDLNNEFLHSHKLNSNIKPRPHSLEDFANIETLENSDLKSNFSLKEPSEDEDIYVMDIPRTINPQQLKGQILHLSNKSKFKLGEDRYCAINRDSKSSLTCVYNTEDDYRIYKTINIKPAGHISLRRKFSGTSKKELKFEKSKNVPYPKNIKLRHPLFGIQINEAIIKCERES